MTILLAPLVPGSAGIGAQYCGGAPIRGHATRAREAERAMRFNPCAAGTAMPLWPCAQTLPADP
ncbi:hypothetical protein ABZ128_27610 [Streptomyces sp. NPDC006326]|uniref:hypothetical protein n=1 Tax=Streptomyces sp. NPDC006326 TaxID=3156752 RepID=UPI0033BA10B6